MRWDVYSQNIVPINICEVFMLYNPRQGSTKSIRPNAPDADIRGKIEGL